MLLYHRVESREDRRTTRVVPAPRLRHCRLAGADPLRHAREHAVADHALDHVLVGESFLEVAPASPRMTELRWLEIVDRTRET